MALVELLISTRIGQTKPIFLILEGLPATNELKIILPDGKIANEKADLFEPPTEGDEIHVTRAQIGAMYLYQRQQEHRTKEDAKRLSEKATSIAELRANLTRPIRLHSINFKFFASYAKANGTLRPDQRKFLYRLGMRSNPSLSDQEAEDLFEIVEKLNTHFNRKSSK